MIEESDDYNQLTQLIQGELNHSQGEILEYLEIWAPFKSAWELDKDQFMAKYKNIHITAEMFDVNISRYTEIENQVLLQQTISKVYFINVNCDKLKRTISEHLDKWRELHKNYLKMNAYEAINSKHFYYNYC